MNEREFEICILYFSVIGEIIKTYVLHIFVSFKVNVKT